MSFFFLSSSKNKICVAPLDRQIVLSLSDIRKKNSMLMEISVLFDLWEAKKLNFRFTRNEVQRERWEYELNK